jgi:hypothetical protein
MGNLSGRLTRLEEWVTIAEASAPDPGEGERIRRYEAALAALAATMDAGHFRLAAEVWRRQADGEPHPPGSEGAIHLARQAEGLIHAAVDGERHFRLALPPAVAAVYLEHAVWPYDRCAECKLLLPYATEYWRGGTPMQHVPAVHFFERCPDCGGPVEHDTYGFRRPAP